MINILTFKARYYNSKIGLNNVLFFRYFVTVFFPSITAYVIYKDYIRTQEYKKNKALVKELDQQVLI